MVVKLPQRQQLSPCCSWTFLFDNDCSYNLSCLSSLVDAAAKDGNIAAVECSLCCTFLQGLRIAIPAAFLIAAHPSFVQDALGFDARLVERWYMVAGGAMVVAVGYAMVINMMATQKYGHSSLSLPLAAIF